MHLLPDGQSNLEDPTYLHYLGHDSIPLMQSYWCTQTFDALQMKSPLHPSSSLVLSHVLPNSLHVFPSLPHSSFGIQVFYLKSSPTSSDVMHKVSGEHPFLFNLFIDGSHLAR